MNNDVEVEKRPKTRSKQIRCFVILTDSLQDQLDVKLVVPIQVLIVRDPRLTRKKYKLEVVSASLPISVRVEVLPLILPVSTDQSRDVLSESSVSVGS